MDDYDDGKPLSPKELRNLPKRERVSREMWEGQRAYEAAHDDYLKALRNAGHEVHVYGDLERFDGAQGGPEVRPGSSTFVVFSATSRITGGSNGRFHGVGGNCRRTGRVRAIGDHISATSSDGQEPMRARRYSQPFERRGCSMSRLVRMATAFVSGFVASFVVAIVADNALPEMSDILLVVVTISAGSAVAIIVSGVLPRREQPKNQG